jgi:hypothetical protein
MTSNFLRRSRGGGSVSVVAISPVGLGAASAMPLGFSASSPWGSGLGFWASARPGHATVASTRPATIRSPEDARSRRADRGIERSRGAEIMKESAQ